MSGLPALLSWTGKFQGRPATAAGREPSATARWPRALQEGLRDGIDGHWTCRRECRSFAIGRPEKVIDFPIVPVHEMAVKSKSHHCDDVLRRRATGFLLDGLLHWGRQALMEAQRYPGDFMGLSPGSRRMSDAAGVPGRIRSGSEDLQSPASVVPSANSSSSSPVLARMRSRIDRLMTGRPADGPTPMPVRSCTTFVPPGADRTIA